MKNKKLLFILPLIFLLALSIVSAVGTPPNSSLSAAYWKLEDLTEEVNSLTLTENGDVTDGVTGIINNGYSFGGIDGYLSRADSADFDLGNTGFICTWFNFDTVTAGQTLLVKNLGGNNNGDFGMNFQLDTTVQIRTWAEDGSNVDYLFSGLTPSTGSWYHVCAGFTSDRYYRLYVNSNNVDNSSMQYNVGLNFMGVATEFKISDGSNDLNGEADEIFISSEAITDDIVAYLYNGGSPQSAPPSQQHPFTQPIVNASSSTESTALVKQVGSVSFSGGAPTIILSSNFNLTNNNTPTYGAYSYNVLSNGANDLFCEVQVDSVVRGNVSRTQSIGDLGSVFIQTETFMLDAGEHTQELICERTAGVGLITINNTIGVGHFLVDEFNNTLPYNNTVLTNINILGGGFQSLRNFTIKIGNQTSTSDIVHNLVVEGSLTYTNNEISNPYNISTYMNINGTNCTFNPRTTNAGTTASASLDCILQNVTANATYQIEILGDASDGTFSGNIVAKDLFIDPDEIEGGTGVVTGLTFSGNNFLMLFNTTGVGNFNHPLSNSFLKASYSVLTDIDTTVSFYLRLANGTNFTTSVWSRDFTAGEIGILSGHDIFQNIPLDTDYVAELWGNCGNAVGNCTIAGGSSFGYITDVTSVIFNAFNITTYDSWDNTSIQTFNATDGSIFTTTNGLITYFTQETLENYTISAPNYLNKTFTNYNTSNDLNTSLSQSNITFNTFEIITGNQLFNINYTIDGKTLIVNDVGSFGLKAGSYNVTASKNGFFDRTQEITVNALDIKTFNITGMSSNVLNLTVRNITGGNYIQNFSGTISSPTIGYSDPFSTINGEVLIPVTNNFNFTVALNTISGMSDFGNTINITSTELNASVVNKTINLYTNNSINFTIRDFDTGLIINTSTTNITMLGSTITYELQTNNGTLFIDQRNDDTYETTISTPTYSDTVVFLTLQNNAHLNVEIFMQTGLVRKSFIVKDNNLVPIDEAILTFSTVVNGTTIVVAQTITDFSGRATVLLDENIRYQFTSVATGFDVFSGEVKPTENEYSITMIQSGTGIFDTVFSDVTYTPTFTYSAGNTIATSGLFINSISGSLEYFGLTTTYQGNTFTNNITTNPSGGFPNITITGITNNTNRTININYFFKSTLGEEFSFNETYLLPRVNGTNISIGNGLFQEVTDLEESNPMRGIVGMIIVTIGVLVFMGATRNLTIGVLGGLIATGLNRSIGLWDPAICLITIIVGLVLIIADNIR